MRTDLNADVGESFGVYALGQDPAIIPCVTSVNVACGFHAGDPGVMRETVALARQHGVAIGAHPGFPDLAGFGRRQMQLTPIEVEDLVVYQIGALAAVAAAQGLRLQHVKPHGALYNMAARDPQLAGAIARAIAAVDRTLQLVGLSGSALIDAGQRAGLRTASEVFADRGYRSNGSLVPRDAEGAVLDDPDAVSARALRMVRHLEIASVDGAPVRVQPDTICVHGDTPGAANLARAIRRALENAGVAVKAMAAD
jgi:5-oxoprolinase (ATP-hydrolysing) subunit A